MQSLERCGEASPVQSVDGQQEAECRATAATRSIVPSQLLVASRLRGLIRSTCMLIGFTATHRTLDQLW